MSIPPSTAPSQAELSAGIDGLQACDIYLPDKGWQCMHEKQDVVIVNAKQGRRDEHLPE